tara:strand:+ start:991 stop:1350 length:360 start_codon:yes stop_codon:yes gene_type:complete
MANPNMASASTITGHSAVAQLSTSTTSLITNGAASGKIIKIESVLVSNVDGTTAADVNAWVLRSSVAYNIASTVSVPADSTLVLVSRDTTIYLMEGDTFQMSASAASDLEVVASYEEIS